MKRVPGNFEREIRSISCQYYVFFFVQMINIIEIIAFYILKKDRQFDDESTIIFQSIS